MAFERPGVYVREVPFQTQITPANTATAAAFVGTALRGPSTPVLINSWSSYVSTFGVLSNDYELGYAVYSFFANGGRDAYVARVVGNAVQEPATFATSALAMETGTGDPATLLTLTAKSAGSWATGGAGLSDGLEVVYTFDPNTLVSGASEGTIRVDSGSLFSAVILYKGVEVERWQELSLDPSSGRYVKDVLDLFSSYVTCSTPTTIAEGQYLVGDVDTGTTIIRAGFGSASNGGTPSASDWNTVINSFNSVEVPLVINFVGQTETEIVTKAVDYASSRGDCFVVVDCAKNADAQAVATQATSLASAVQDESYCAIYFPALKLADPARSGPAAIRTCFAGGTVVGAYIRSETTRGVAKAPAGYSLDLRNVFGLAVTPTEAQEASLYNTNHVNVVRSLPGGTFVINGARTLAKQRPNKFIPVRRTLNFLKSSLEAQTGFAVFEPNDSRLWDKVKNQLSQYLTNFWAAGNLKGATPAQAFYITCDESNNTPSTIGDGYLNIEVGVSLLNPAEFVIINISQWTGDNTL